MSAWMMQEVEELHLDEATWLWTQWERALVAPDYDLADTAEVEERLLAHVDGLVEGGEPVAKALLWPALESEDPPRVGASTLALLNEGLTEERVRALLSHTCPTVQRAMEICERTGLGEVLQSLAYAKAPEVRLAALKVLVARDELSDAVLRHALAQRDPWSEVAALRGLRALPQAESRRLLSAALASHEPKVQAAAIEAGLTAGIREAWEACRRALKSQSREFLVLWAMGGNEDDAGLLVELLRVPERRADALWALGFCGRVSAAEACLEWMADEKLARLAAESFSSITGLRMEGSWVLPEGASPEQPIPLEEDDLAADLVPRSEDELPMPNAEAVSAWWREARHGFHRGTRYLMGHAFQGEVLWMVLERGPMRRRHVWARELAIRSQGACRITTRALTRRQRVELNRSRAHAARIPTSPFARLLTR